MPPLPVRLLSKRLLTKAAAQHRGDEPAQPGADAGDSRGAGAGAPKPSPPHFRKGVHDTSTRESFYFKSPNSWLSCHRFGATWQDTEFFVPFFTPGQYTLQMRYYPAQAPDFVCADPVLLLLVLLVLLLLLLLLMATADFTSDVVVRRPEPGQMRIGAHADSNGFTIVRLDGRPGLEVRIADSEGTRHWVPVSLPEGSPDALVVNTGRMIERWTGGHFKAAIHRVVLDGEAARSERMSLAFFSSPNTTARIETIGPAADTAVRSQLLFIVPSRCLLLLSAGLCVFAFSGF